MPNRKDLMISLLSCDPIAQHMYFIYSIPVNAEGTLQDQQQYIDMKQTGVHSTTFGHFSLFGFLSRDRPKRVLSRWQAFSTSHL